jgi:hypothetical protein
MQKRIAFHSKTVYMLMAGAFLLLGLQGCMKDYVRCEVIEGGVIIHHSDEAEVATELARDPDGRPGAPGACYTTQVTSPYSASGYVKLNSAMQITGTAPAGALCISTTSKCSSPGSAGCGRTSPNKCRHAWIEQTVGNLTNPCGCVCAP